MKIAYIVKRHYSRQDLIKHSFGRYGHLPKEQVRLGHSVRVWTLDYRGGPPVQIQRDGVSFVSHPLPKQAFRDKQLREQVRGFDPDCVISGGHAPFGLIAARAKAKRAALIFDIYDYYPAFASPAFRSLARFYFWRSIRCADGLSLASPALDEALARKSSAPSQVVRNSVDIGSFDSDPQPAPKDPRDLTLKVVYLGGIANYVMLEETLEALSVLRQEGLPISLIHAGPSDKKRLKPSELYRPIGNLPQSEIPKLLRNVDIAIAPYKDCEQVRYSNACKLSEFAAAEACAVLSRNGDWASIVDGDYPGLFDPNQPGSLLAALRRQIHRRVPVVRPPDIGWASEARKLEQLVQAATASLAHA